jgi:hypothetical protein
MYAHGMACPNHGVPATRPHTLATANRLLLASHDVPSTLCAGWWHRTVELPGDIWTV